MPVFLVGDIVFVNARCLSCGLREYNAAVTRSRFKGNSAVCSCHRPCNAVALAEHGCALVVLHAERTSQRQGYLSRAVKLKYAVLAECEAMLLDILLCVGSERLHGKPPGSDVGACYHIVLRVGHKDVRKRCGNCEIPLRGFKHYSLAVEVGEKLGAFLYEHALLSTVCKPCRRHADCRGNRLCRNPEQVQKFQAAFVGEPVEPVNSPAEHLREEHSKRRAAVGVVLIELPLGGVRPALFAYQGKDIAHCSAVKLR
ncbi:unknown [Eubacterium sp. CAG:786]|nr:unknown [Eubacterium sp. CAG:786]